MTPSNSYQQKLAAGGAAVNNSAATIVVLRAMYQFDASREDELSVKDGDLINVDLTVKTDEGWVWGECNGRTGVFPASFAMKLSDFEYACITSI